jgi:hypothetical protein
MDWDVNHSGSAKSDQRIRDVSVYRRGLSLTHAGRLSWCRIATASGKQQTALVVMSDIRELGNSAVDLGASRR